MNSRVARSFAVTAIFVAMIVLRGAPVESGNSQFFIVVSVTSFGPGVIDVKLRNPETGYIHSITLYIDLSLFHFRTGDKVTEHRDGGKVELLPFPEQSASQDDSNSNENAPLSNNLTCSEDPLSGECSDEFLESQSPIGGLSLRRSMNIGNAGLLLADDYVPGPDVDPTLQFLVGFSKKLGDCEKDEISNVQKLPLLAFSKYKKIMLALKYIGTASSVQSVIEDLSKLNPNASYYDLGLQAGQVICDGKDLKVRVPAFRQPRYSSIKLSRQIEVEEMRCRHSNEAAHHLVAGREPVAEPARNILTFFEIDVNSFYNGIHLKCAIHKNIHTTNYFEYVNTIMADAESRRQAIQILMEIGTELMQNPGHFYKGITQSVP